MIEATWDGIPDPASESFVVGSIDGPWRSPDLRSLIEAKARVWSWDADTHCVYAWVGGEHRRVPDGEPPKPAPVVTIDGVEVTPAGWVVVRMAGHRFDTREEAQREVDKADVQVTGRMVVVPVLLPEEGT